MADQRTHTPMRLSSAFERIAADYPEWTISRDPSPGQRAVWAATRCGVRMTAPSPAGLLVRLEVQELARLQEEYGGRYEIRRTPTLWIATRRADDGTEPTLIKDTSYELEAAMRSPGSWGQVPYSRRPQ